MRYVGLWLLLPAMAHGQITLQVKPVGPILDYYTAHTNLDGDTNYCTQTGPAFANGAPAGTSVLNLNDGTGNHTITGSIICTINDGHTSLGGGNIGIFKFTVLDMGSGANTTVVAVNQMASYGTNPGAANVPAGWSGKCTIGTANACDWKSGKIISIADSTGSWLVLPIARQEVGPYYAAGDSSIIASPDGGAHWCNARTFMTHATAPGCDASNWQADGDAPLPPSDSSYTGTPSTVMWKDVAPFDGTNNTMGRLAFFDYCQDESCTGSPHGADTYLYGFALNGRQTRYSTFRVLKNINSVMDVTAYGYYTCANYSPTNVCDGTVSGNWSSTQANMTLLFAGSGANASGSGAVNINPRLTNLTGHIFGSPVYYCANGGCAYVATFLQNYLSNGLNRSKITAFPTPWGPFTEPTSEFHNPIDGFWSILRYTLSVPDSEPYHVRFVMIANTYAHVSTASLYLQAADFTLGANQSGMSLAGCTPYRFTWSPVAGSIIRRGLWGFFDFFSHGCYDKRVGNVYEAAVYSNDLSTYPSNKQLIGCYTDGTLQCALPNDFHQLKLLTNGLWLGTNGYQPHFQLRDMVPGVYNSITSSPFTSSADPEWTVSFVVQPNDISTSNQGLLQAGTFDHRFIALASSGTAGKVGIIWEYPAGNQVIVTSNSAHLANGVWAYITITKTAGVVNGGSGNAKIYINGVQVATGQSGSPGTPSMQPGPMLVGTFTSTNNFGGSFGAMEIYSRALSPAEIQHNYKTQKARLLASRGIVIP